MVVAISHIILMGNTCFLLETSNPTAMDGLADFPFIE